MFFAFFFKSYLNRAKNMITLSLTLNRCSVLEIEYLHFSKY